MAYMDKETAKNIRQALKAKYPEIKFSVRIKHHMSLDVTLVKSPYFQDNMHRQINQYWIDTDTSLDDKQKDVLKGIKDTILTVGEHFDDSDIMTDYFHCAFYYDISVGRFDKPHEKVEA